MTEQFDDLQPTDDHRQPRWASGDVGIDVREDSVAHLSIEQRRLLETALASGYFAVPRRTTLVDLAAEHDLSPEAASRQLRHGIAKALARQLG